MEMLIRLFYGDAALKKKSENYVIELHSVPSRARFIKGLFSSANQGIVPYSVCAKIQLMST